jgi:hypothetical protein
MAMDVSVPEGQAPLAELTFVGATEVTRADDGDLPGALNYMTVNSEPMNDRSFWSADWVVYLVASTNSSYLAISNEPGYNNLFPLPQYFAPYAESVVLYNRAVNDTSGSNDHEPYCFAHEFGHIFGMNHDNTGTDNTNNTPLTSYAFGHWAPAEGGGTRTVMSYLAPGCTPPCPRIINYSNPNVQVPPEPGGFVTGTATAYNAQMVTNNVGYVMQYMPSLGRIFVNGFERYNQQ